MRPEFYSKGAKKAVQASDQQKRLKSLVFMSLVFAALWAALSYVGYTELQSDLLESQSPQNAPEQSTGATGAIYEPMDMQPAYGLYAFQPATSGWSLQGDIR